MRILFFGTASFAVPSLERLAASGHVLEACVTQPDRAAGRGLRPEAPPVKLAALRLGLPLLQPERASAALCGARRVDAGVVAAYGQLIPSDLLALPTHGLLGLHPSLLPKYRGAAPVAWALLKGETETGVTIFRLNERLDAGAIVGQRRVAIAPQEDAAALTARLAEIGAEELLGALARIEEGRERASPQDESEATLAPKFNKAQGTIEWQWPAEDIVRLVRAMVPWPGASTSWRGRTLKVWQASAAPLASTFRAMAPGSVAHAGDERLLIAAGKDAVQLDAVQLAGRKRMRAREFLVGHRIEVGERLGPSG